MCVTEAYLSYVEARLEEEGKQWIQSWVRNKLQDLKNKGRLYGDITLETEDGITLLHSSLDEDLDEIRDYLMEKNIPFDYELSIYDEDSQVQKYRPPSNGEKGTLYEYEGQARGLNMPKPYLHTWELRSMMNEAKTPETLWNLLQQKLSEIDPQIIDLEDYVD